jgi:hypothetical protein
LREPDTFSDEIITGALDTYTFAVQVNNGLAYQTGKLELSIPAQLSLEDGASCSAFEESSLNLLSCVIEEGKLVVTHTNTDYDYLSETILIKV